MKVAQELKQGSTIRIGNVPFIVMKAEFNKSGRNSAVMKLKMKNLLAGNTVDTVLKADDKVDDIRLERVTAVYSYSDGDNYIFSNPETWDQIELSKEELGNTINYLEEEMAVEIQYYEETPVSVELPTFIKRKIEYTEPGLRGDTTGKALKVAKLITEFEIQVPLFVEQGEWIKIDTRNNTYVERIKN